MGYHRKPDPPDRSDCYYPKPGDDLILTVEWFPGAPAVMPLNPDMVKAEDRGLVALWLVREGEKRGVEWTPAEALKLVFG